MSLIVRMLASGVAVLFLMLTRCETEIKVHGKEGKEPAVPESIETGKSLSLDGDRDTEITLNDKCAGVTLYQLDGDTLKQSDIKTNAEGEATGVFFLSRVAVPTGCKLLVGEEEYEVVGSTKKNHAAGLLKALGKWQRGEEGDELQVELGVEPSVAARLFVSVNEGRKWTEQRDLRWQEDAQTNKSALLYNVQNITHNQAMLQVGEHWSFLAVPAVEQVHINRLFRVSGIWAEEEVRVKIDGFPQQRGDSCMRGLTAFYLDDDGVMTQFDTDGLTLTPDADGDLNIIFAARGTAVPRDDCDYVLSVGGALAVLDLQVDDSAPRSSDLSVAEANNKVQITLPALPAGIGTAIVMYVLDAAFFNWEKHSTTVWQEGDVATEIDWVAEMSHVLLKVSRNGTDYWLYR